MKKLKQRGLSLLLILVMIAGTLQVSVFAKWEDGVWSDEYSVSWDLNNTNGNFTSAITDAELPTMETVLVQKNGDNEYTEITNTENVTGDIYVAIKAKNFSKFAKNEKGTVLISTSLVFDTRYLSLKDTTNTEWRNNAIDYLNASATSFVAKGVDKDGKAILGSYSVNNIATLISADFDDGETSPIAESNANLQKVTLAINYDAEELTNEDELASVIDEGTYLAVYPFTVKTGNDVPKDSSMGVALSRSGDISVSLQNGSSGFSKSYTKIDGLQKYLKLVDGVNLFPNEKTEELKPEELDIEELKIETTSLKRGQAYSPYSDSIVVSGGVKPYTYSSSTLPSGLTLDPETGVISGIPTENAQFRVNFYVTDSENNTAQVTSVFLPINPRLVDFRISDYNYTYSEDTAPYKATLECITPGIPDNVFSVYYGPVQDKQTEVYNASQYPIHIVAPGYEVRYVYGLDNEARRLHDYTLNIYRNQSAEISVESANHIYTGESYAAKVTTVPSDLSYEVTYRKLGETVETSQAPSEVGSYAVFARTTDSNYAERTATGTITIGYRIIQFNVEAEESYTYNGNPQSPTVTTVDEIPNDAWQVKYRNTVTEEITETAPKNAGTYEIIIDFKDNPYEEEFLSSNTFTINPMPVDFNVTAEHTVIQEGSNFTNFDITATPIDNTLVTANDYNVYVVDEDNHRHEITSESDKLGTYRTRVRITNPNFTLGNVNELTLVVAGGCDFAVAPEKAEIVYGEKFDIAVTAKNSALHSYIVSLINEETGNEYILSEIGEETGEHQHEEHWGNTELLDVGTYTVNIEHEDSEHHFIGDIEGNTTLTVVPLEVDFEVTAAPEAIAEGSGDAFTFNVKPSTDLINENDYTVVIKDASGNEYDADSTNLTFGNYTADIKINDGVANFIKGEVTSNTFRVARGLVNFNITASPLSEITYGENFTLNVDTIPEMQEETDYKITVLDAENKPCDLTETLDAGNYSIKVEMLNESYAIGTVNAPALKVNPLPITFDVQGDNVEEGNAFNITASPLSELVQDDDYIIEIMNLNTHDVYPCNATLPRGVYATKITVTNPNFIYDGSSEISIYVLKKTINFDIEAAQSEITYGEKFNLTITPSDVTGYTVSLVDKDGNPHDVNEILDAGEYTVLIKYDGEEYEVGEYTELTLTVKPAQIVFTVSGDTEFDYVQGVKHTVDVTNEAGITDYTVQYKLNGNLSDDAEMPGEYEIVVTINNPNYTAAAIDEKLIIRDTSVMNMGNSPAAMILKYGGEDAEQLLYQFGENHTIDAELNGITDTIVYNDTIWNDIDNLDLDRFAVFVRNFTEFQDPGLTYTNDEGETITINGEIDGSESINPKERAIYDVVYRYNGIERVRKLVVLGSKTANANGDRYVNSIDANFIYTLIGTEPETIAEKIFYYRICDLDQDGRITQEDVDVITNRFETPINEYYPWVVK